MAEAKKIYGHGPCQVCARWNLVLTSHHKKKRSDRGTEIPENLIAVCWGNFYNCHEKIHRDDDLFQRVKASSANIANREIFRG